MTGMLSSCFLNVSEAELIRILGPCSVGIEGSANCTVTSPCIQRHLAAEAVTLQPPCYKSVFPKKYKL